MSEPFRINRVVLKNYRSIAECDVELKNLTFLTGPNGSGKSNFLNSLMFVADSLSSTPGKAANRWGGLGNICHWGRTADKTLTIHLWFGVRGRFEGEYSFTLRAGSQNVVIVLNEDCLLRETETGNRVWYSIAPGRPIDSSDGIPPVVADDSLHLVHAGSVARGLRPLYDALSMMGLCNPDPGAMRRPALRTLGEQDTLTINSDNIVLVLGHLRRTHPWVRSRIDDYLRAVVPNLVSVQDFGEDDYRFLKFLFDFPQGKGLQFGTQSISDGTLRALGVLTGAFQRPEHISGYKVAVLGIEEPETALHPAAARVLFDALTEAAESRQLIVSTHSPDLLDSDDVEVDSILAVQMGEDGATQIGALNEAGRSVLRDRLYTPGELMRINHLQPRREVSDSLKLSDRVDIELSPDEQ